MTCVCAEAGGIGAGSGSSRRRGVPVGHVAAWPPGTGCRRGGSSAGGAAAGSSLRQMLMECLVCAANSGQGPGHGETPAPGGSHSLSPIEELPLLQDISSTQMPPVSDQLGFRHKPLRDEANPSPTLGLTRQEEVFYVRAGREQCRAGSCSRAQVSGCLGKASGPPGIYLFVLHLPPAQRPHTACWDLGDTKDPGTAPGSLQGPAALRIVHRGVLFLLHS